MSEIDVSKCAFYSNGKCNNPNGMACNCCNNVYCYYKELQQLKEHCEQGGETIKTLFQEICELTKENNELKKYIDRAGIIGIVKVLKCLDEIDSFAKVHYCANCTDLGACPECYENFRNQILEKIKEVKDNE